MIKRIPQRTQGDCVICVLAMVMGPPYSYELFVEDVFNRAADDAPGVTDVKPNVFDIAHPFIDQQQIVVPGLRPLDSNEVTGFGNAMALRADRNFSFDDIRPSVLQDVQVPADGIHLEVAEGGCRLKNVPDERGRLKLSIKEANIEAEVHSAGRKLHEGPEGSKT